MKRVLIISTGPRKGGNSETLAAEFGRGSRDSGHEVEMISLRDKTIGYCRGCLAGQTTGSCVIRDDAPAIPRKCCTPTSLALRRLSISSRCAPR